MRERQRIGLLVLLGLAMLFWLAPAPARAAGPIDTEKEVRLTLDYRHEGQAISGAEVRLYKVAAVDAYGAFTRTPDFAAYPLQTEGLDQQGWQSLALTLSAYAQRDRLPVYDSGLTAADGSLVFPSRDTLSMKPGLYLVLVSKRSLDGYLYSAAPFLAALPAEDRAANDWSYALRVSPKHEREREPEKVDIKVLKIWQDQGNESGRPEEIRVQLLKDGEVFDTVTLSQKNNWRFTWTELEPQYQWTLVEEEVPGYTVKLEQQGGVYMITNSRPPLTPTPTPPPVVPPSAPPKLPQTGMLWWPVQLLAIAGIVLIVVGILQRKGGRDEA